MLFLSMHCNKLKLNFLTFVLILLAGSSFGQQYAEVRLKKGMVLKGELVSVSKDKQVVLKATWKDSIILDWDDIALSRTLILSILRYLALLMRGLVVVNLIGAPY